MIKYFNLKSTTKLVEICNWIIDIMNVRNLYFDKTFYAS